VKDKVTPYERYLELQNSGGEFIGDEAWFEAKGIRDTINWFVGLIHLCCCDECLTTIMRMTKEGGLNYHKLREGK